MLGSTSQHIASEPRSLGVVRGVARHVAFGFQRFPWLPTGKCIHWGREPCFKIGMTHTTFPFGPPLSAPPKWSSLVFCKGPGVWRVVLGGPLQGSVNENHLPEPLVDIVGLCPAAFEVSGLRCPLCGCIIFRVGPCLERFQTRVNMWQFVLKFPFIGPMLVPQRMLEETVHSKKPCRQSVRPLC